MRALVLAGGGAKGATCAGMLHNSGTDYDIIVGTSAGALNAVGLSYLGLEGLERLWKSIRSRSDVFSFGWSTEGLYSAEPLKKMIRAAIGRREPRCPATWVSSVCLETGELVYSSPDDKHFLSGVVASCSLPGIVKPQKIAGLTYVDGGVRENAPLQRAVDLGAREIDVMLCNPIGPLEPWSLPEVDALPAGHLAARAFDIMCHEIMMNDIKKTKDVTLRVWAPDQMPCSTLDFSRETIHAAMSIGMMVKPVVL